MGAYTTTKGDAAEEVDMLTRVKDALKNFVFKYLLCCCTSNSGEKDSSSTEELKSDSQTEPGCGASVFSSLCEMIQKKK